MDISKLKEILSSDVDCGATLVTVGKDGAHVTNTWNSFIDLVSDDTIYIPAGGYKVTEENLKNNSSIKLSVTNRVVAGKSGSGTGVIIEGTGKISYDAAAVSRVKENFPWIRAVLEISIENMTQTM